MSRLLGEKGKRDISITLVCSSFNLCDYEGFYHIPPPYCTWYLPQKIILYYYLRGNALLYLHVTLVWKIYGR